MWQLYLNKTGDCIGNSLINIALNNLQPTGDFTGLLILHNRPHYEEFRQ